MKSKKKKRLHFIQGKNIFLAIFFLCFISIATAIITFVATRQGYLSSQAAETTFRVALVLVQYNESPSNALPLPTAAEIERDLVTQSTSFTKYIKHVTAGRMDVQYQVFGPIRMAAGTSHLSPTTCNNLAARAVNKADVDRGIFTKAFVLHTKIGGCEGVSENFAPFFASGPYTCAGCITHYMLHELGHTFAMYHDLKADDSTKYSGADPMGHNVKARYSIHNLCMHLLPSCAGNIRWVSSNGMYDIVAGTDNTLPTGLRITSGDVTYLVEYRISNTPSADLTGVQIRREGPVTQIYLGRPLNSLADTFLFFNPKRSNHRYFDVGDVFADTVNGTPVRIKVVSANNSQAKICVDMNNGDYCNNTPSGNLPHYLVNSIVNSASGQRSLTAGNWATIYGQDLISDTSCPKPSSTVQELCGTKVIVNNNPAGMNYASKTQLNFLVPGGATSIKLQVINRAGSGPLVDINLDQHTLALYSQNGSGTGLVSAYQNGQLITLDKPALANVNSEITLYASGLGAYTTSNNQAPEVKINGYILRPEYVIFADQTPSAASLVKLSSLPSGDLRLSSGTRNYPIQLCKNNLCGNTVQIPIKVP